MLPPLPPPKKDNSCGKFLWTRPRNFLMHQKCVFKFLDGSLNVLYAVVYFIIESTLFSRGIFRPQFMGPLSLFREANALGTSTSPSELPDRLLQKMFTYQFKTVQKMWPNFAVIFFSLCKMLVFLPFLDVSNNIWQPCHTCFLLLHPEMGGGGGVPPSTTAVN